MTRRITASILVGLVPILLSAGSVQANHVKVEISMDPQRHEPPVVIQPAPPPAVAAPTTLQAEEIEANQVRAQSIYANKIEADEIHGIIHQTGRVKIDGARAEIKAPTVVASVIFAEKINANSVIADVIYVREIKRR